MAMRLRQVVLVAGDLDRVEAEIVAGLDVEACVHDLGVGQFGLRNVLFPVGDTLLEVVSPGYPFYKNMVLIVYFLNMNHDDLLRPDVNIFTDIICLYR